MTKSTKLPFRIFVTFLILFLSVFLRGKVFFIYKYDLQYLNIEVAPFEILQPKLTFP